MDSLQSLLIVGASVRAAAWSALRAGWSPICVDLFADEDLKSIAPCVPIPRFPRGVLEATRTVPKDVPWLYTGAVENHPRLIERITRERPLLGASAQAVRAVRNPRRLAEIVADAGLRHIAYPPIWPDLSPPSAEGRWMLRPRRGAAGRGIEVWDAAARGSPTLHEPHFFQARVDGIPVSAVARTGFSTATLIGFSQQWIGRDVCSAAPFQYCGSVGPIRMPADIEKDVRQLVARLATRFAWNGLFGLDFLWDGATLHLTEVNPRYPASAELYEFATGAALLRRPSVATRTGESVSRVDRLDPSRTDLLDSASESRTSPTSASDAAATAARCVGKAILYAPRDLVVGELPLTRFSPDRPELPALADIPAPGSRVARGHPICTIFATGRTAESCERQLEANLARWRDEICRA